MYHRRRQAITDRRRQSASRSLPVGPCASTALRIRLRDTFGSPDYEPPKLPRIAMQLMELSRRPDVELREVLRLLEQDPLLAAAVMRIARSAAYAGPVEVVTLHQAVMRLGLSTMRDIVLEASMTTELFRAPGYEQVMEALYRHSNVVAHVTRYISSASDIPNDYAFLCGLMHDIGVAASLAIIAHRQTHPTPLEAIWDAIEETHPEAGAVVVNAWNLPRDVTEVVAAHHDLTRHGKVERVAAVVSMADGFAVREGFGYRVHGDRNPADVDLQIKVAGRALGVAGERLAHLGRGVMGLLSRLRGG